MKKNPDLSCETTCQRICNIRTYATALGNAALEEKRRVEGLRMVAQMASEETEQMRSEREFTDITGVEQSGLTAPERMERHRLQGKAQNDFLEAIHGNQLLSQGSIDADALDRMANVDVRLCPGYDDRSGIRKGLDWVMGREVTCFSPGHDDNILGTVQSRYPDMQS